MSLLCPRGWGGHRDGAQAPVLLGDTSPPCPDLAVPAGARGALADLQASVLSLVVTVTQCVLFSVCAAVPVLPVQLATFVLQVISRSFLYGGNAAFLAIA